MSRFNVMPRACRHTWTMFCQGDYGPYPLYTPGWQINICIHCYAKLQVIP